MRQTKAERMSDGLESPQLPRRSIPAPTLNLDRADISHASSTLSVLLRHLSLDSPNCSIAGQHHGFQDSIVLSEFATNV